MSKIKNVLSPKSIIRVARTEYIKLITDPRIIIVGMLLIIIQNMVVDPLINRSVKLGEPLNIVEPFIAVCNSTMLLLFIPSVFIILISDFPDINTHTLFIIKRSGKTNWLFGQIGAVLFYIISYLAVIFIACCGFTSSHCFVGSEWSDTATKYLSHFPQERDSFISEFLPTNLYNQMSLTEALIHTVAFFILNMLTIALVLILFRILHFKMAGIFLVFFMIGGGLLFSATDNSLSWIFPISHAVILKHYVQIMREPIMPLWISYLYFIGLILLLTVINLVVINKININTTGEQT